MISIGICPAAEPRPVCHCSETYEVTTDILKSLRPRRNGQHFALADGIFKRIFFNENV